MSQSSMGENNFDVENTSVCWKALLLFHNNQLDLFDNSLAIA